jgi:hypothetical protein
MNDEWRVEIELGDERHHLTLGERLRSLDLDDEARERLGDRVIVTRDGDHMFLYAGSQQAAREAERVARELIASEGLVGELRLSRWDAADEAWKDVSGSPQSEEKGSAEARGPEPEWEVRVDLPGLRETLELAQRLEEEGLDVRRRWRHVLIGTPTEREAAELAKRVSSESPQGAEVQVEPAGGVPHPVFVFIGAHKPEIARDLGL